MYKKLIFSALALGCTGTLPSVPGEVQVPAPRAAAEREQHLGLEDGVRATAAAARPSRRQPRTLFEARTDFNHVVVQEEDGLRNLLFEPSLAIQSSVRLGHPLDLQLAYTRAAMVAMAAHPAPRRVLVVGLGGGAMPMFLRAIDPRLLIDVAEIDPVVIRAARGLMGFQEDALLRVHVGDGRRFIEESAVRYDVIFLDAYGPSDIPVSLTTVEFLKIARAHLSEDGLIAGNVWSPRFNDLYEAMHRSYREAFGEHLCVLDAEGSGNRIFLARADGVPFHWKEIVRRAEALTRDKGLPFDLGALARPGCRQDVPLSAEPLWDE